MSSEIYYRPLRNEVAVFEKDEAQIKAGCEVEMTFEGAGFEGSTKAASCPSRLRGASFATAKVSIGPGIVESWDQGFDTEGYQVWGAVKGPYVFERLP